LSFVDTTVHFDDQVMQRGVEIEHEAPDRMLPPKTNTAESLVLKRLPKNRFRLGHFAAHGAGNLLNFS